MTTSSTSNTNASLSTILSSLSNGSVPTTGTTNTSGTLISAGQIDVTTLVSQLMSVQSQPLVALQQREAGVKSKLSAYGQEQSALSSLQTAASALALPGSFQASAATVSGSGVAATVTGNPASATYSVSVSSLAQSQSIASTPASTTAPLGTGTLTLQLGAYNSAGTSFTANSSASPITITIDSTNNTLGGIAAAINKAAAGSVSASVVTDASGSRLVMSSANTGVSNGFTVAATGTGLGQFAYGPGVTGMSQTQAAGNAAFTVNGLALTSATNSVTTAISGVTLNLTQAPLPNGAPLQSQISVASNPSAITSTVQGFISAYNSVVTLANSLTNYNAGSNTASVLTGDFTTRTVIGSLQSIVGGQTAANGAGSNYAYLAQIGVSANSDGTLTLDASKFQAALAADPTSVSKMFTTATGTGNQQGFAAQIGTTVKQLIGTGGALGAAQTALNSQVSYMDTQQSQMQAELSITQARLTQEYSQLNSKLVQAQQEQVSLANSLAALPG